MPETIWTPDSGHFPSLGFSDYPILLEYQCCECCARVQAYSVGPMGTEPIVGYQVVRGEWPQGLTIDSQGCINGVIGDNRVTSPSKMGNPPLKIPYDMGNYPQFTRPGLNAEFVVRASNGSEKTFTMYITTDWSSRRDDFILHIKSEYPNNGNPDTKTVYPEGEGYTFFLDGKPVDNETYLRVMKSRDYFPGPGPCSPYASY